MGILWKTFSVNFCKIQRKTTAMEFRNFSKRRNYMAGVFLWILRRFSEQDLLQNDFGDSFEWLSAEACVVENLISETYASKCIMVKWSIFSSCKTFLRTRSKIQ